jgi:hypothetical protein
LYAEYDILLYIEYEHRGLLCYCYPAGYTANPTFTQACGLSALGAGFLSACYAIGYTHKLEFV